MDDIYKNIDECNQIKNQKYWLYLMIANKLNITLTKLFFTGRQLKSYPVFIPQSFFAVPKNNKLNSSHYFVLKNMIDLL